MHHRIVHRLLGCSPKPKPITDNSVFPLSTTKNHISISLATQKPTDYPFLWQQLSPAAQLLEMHLVLWAVSAAQNLSPTAQFFTFCGSASFAWPALGCSSRAGHPSFSLNRHLTTVSSSSSAFEYSCQYFQYYINHIFKLGLMTFQITALSASFSELAHQQ